MRVTSNLVSSQISTVSVLVTAFSVILGACSRIYFPTRPQYIFRDLGYARFAMVEFSFNTCGKISSKARTIHKQKHLQILWPYSHLLFQSWYCKREQLQGPRNPKAKDTAGFKWPRLTGCPKESFCCIQENPGEIHSNHVLVVSMNSMKQLLSFEGTNLKGHWFFTWKSSPNIPKKRVVNSPKNKHSSQSRKAYLFSKNDFCLSACWLSCRQGTSRYGTGRWHGGNCGKP